MTREGGATGIQWVEAKDDANLLKMYLTALMTRIYLLQEVNSDAVEKPWSKMMGRDRQKMKMWELLW